MSGFPHQRLDVYQLALELAVVAKGIADSVPRGYRGLADQLIRSAPAVVLLIAEGANRATDAQKRQRFVEARGECGEAAATAELLLLLELVPEEPALQLQRIAQRVSQMLTALIKRYP